MSNIGIRIDALKFKGAFMRNLQGKSATKRCLIIPVDDNPNIFLGEKGCYMNFTGVEVQNSQYGDSHFIKADTPKDVYDKMTDEERKAQPIFGNIHPIKPREMAVTGSLSIDDNQPQDDLPF